VLNPRFYMQVVTVDKLNAVWAVVEAFGNATTTTTANATRFTQLFSLDIDQSGLIVSASIQVRTLGHYTL